MDIYEMNQILYISKVTGFQPTLCEQGESIKERKSQEQGQMDRVVSKVLWQELLMLAHILTDNSR